MQRAVNSIDPAELADLLAIVDGARAHRPAEPDYHADAMLLLHLMDERRIRLTAAGWKPRPAEATGGGCLTGTEVRMARARLQLSKRELAKRAGLHILTLTRFENGAGASLPGTAQALTCALRSLGSERE